MTFGERLKELREQAGLTQAQLAEQVGVYRETTARLEANKHDPGWSLVQALTRVFEVSTEAFNVDAIAPPACRPAPARPPYPHRRR
jgi:putative transcriptional regulator